MEILNGTPEGLEQAVAVIVADPCPDHVEEEYLVTGVRRTMEDMLRTSIENSRFVSYAVFGEKGAYVGGIADNPPWTRNILVHQLWLLGSAGIGASPRLTLKASRRMMDTALTVLEYPHVLQQLIPVEYPVGIRFAEVNGFEVVEHIWGGSGKQLAVVERSL